MDAGQCRFEGSDSGKADAAEQKGAGPVPGIFEIMDWLSGTEGGPGGRAVPGGSGFPGGWSGSAAVRGQKIYGSASGLIRAGSGKI